MARKIILTATALAAAIFMLFPTTVFATHGFGTEVIDFYVGGQHFEVYGYRGDSAVRLPAVRLIDLAYMLDTTPAQFDIAQPPEDGIWDFWIRRGENFTPTGNEMQPIPYRFALFGSYGLIPEGWGSTIGFVGNPQPTVFVGFDGEDYPAFSVSLRSVQDIDEIYLSVYELSYWLGFHLVGGNTLAYFGWWDSGGALEIVTTPQTVQTPGRHINRNTFPVGSRQMIAYAYALRVRIGPSNDHDVLTFVHRGEEFEILDFGGGFVQIATDRGLGWIFAGFLSRDK